SWDDAKQYVAWLARITGKSYRLLTEAEWEYAARAGSGTRYAWGDDIRHNGQVMANCNGCGSKWDDKQTAPDGQFPANSFGLPDMHGNVWEWVEDCYYDNYADAPSGAEAKTRKDCRFRVLRGGSWGGNPQNLRAALRNVNQPGNRVNFLGLRLART